MNTSVFLLLLLSFGSIFLVTVAFFRGSVRRNAKWWATALPYMLCPAFLIIAYAMKLHPVTPTGWAGSLGLAAVVLSVASIALLYFTWGTHRIPLALFHQDDAPQHIVTHGAYSRIRHPFYTSYILIFLAALAFFPHWGTLFFAVYMIVALNLTAAGEERRLSNSEFGSEYRQYVARSGRFFPRLARGPRQPIPAAPERAEPSHSPLGPVSGSDR
jgi:protein-S-isoprenylcysteine O-methyltransferase Ste14